MRLRPSPVWLLPLCLAAPLETACQLGARAPRLFAEPEAAAAQVPPTAAAPIPTPAPPPAAPPVSPAPAAPGAVAPIAPAPAAPPIPAPPAAPAAPGSIPASPPGAPAQAYGGPVAMAGGDPQHSGRSPFVLPKTTPTERWRFQTQGRIAAAPTLARDGTIFFGSHDTSVYALSPEGTLRWQFQTADFVWSSPALGRDGFAFVGSDDDKIYSLRALDGTMRWSLAPGGCRWATGRGPEAARCDIEQVTLGPDGTLYTGGDAIYALNGDGTLRWRFAPGTGAALSPTGQPVPSNQAGRKVHCGSAPALALDGSIYAACQDTLYALAPDGSKRWEWSGASQSDFDGGPVVGRDGTVFLGSDDRRLYALTPQGQVRFAFVAGGAIHAPPSLGPDGSVYFGAYDGAMYALRPDGTLAWTFRTADSIHAAALVDAQGAVLFGSRDDRLYAVGPDGRLRWSVVFDADLDAPPTLGPDGTVYVGGDDRVLHALR